MSSGAFKLLGLIAAAWVVSGCVEQPDSGPSSAFTTGIRFLGEGASDGYARATTPRQLRFPADHGAHPQFKTEWWYFTGNLVSDEQRHFGFEVTFFRYALAPEVPIRASSWAGNQIWMAHFAITDTQNERFLTDERISRESLGLAGASNDSLNVWVRNWSARQQEPGGRIVLAADGGDTSLRLELDAVSDIVLQGDRGIDRKGPEPGSASFYYSVPRLRANGTIQVPGEPRIEVQGAAWLDREWATRALSPGVEGWDWFALQLSDGRDVMFYRLRGTDGSASPFSRGTISGPAGSVLGLDAEQVALAPLDFWTSPATGIRYPVEWQLSIPDHGLELHVVPYIPNQEVDLSVRYWEGAVSVTGTDGGETISGQGYLELAGYSR